MGRMLALLLGTALAQLDFAQVTTQSVSVPPGTGVEIELLQDVSSETLKAGQTIPFKLVRPIELNGETVLPAGTPATGIVETVQTSRKFCLQRISAGQSLRTSAPAVPFSMALSRLCSGFWFGWGSICGSRAFALSCRCGSELDGWKTQSF